MWNHQSKCGIQEVAPPSCQPQHVPVCNPTAMNYLTPATQSSTYIQWWIMQCTWASIWYSRVYSQDHISRCVCGLKQLSTSDEWNTAVAFLWHNIPIRRFLRVSFTISPHYLKKGPVFQPFSSSTSTSLLKPIKYSLRKQVYRSTP